MRQALGFFMGILWGLFPLKGFLGLVLYVCHNNFFKAYDLFLICFRFALVSAGIIYLYFSSFQHVDEEEFGGTWELLKEGFMTSFAGFLVSI